MKTGSIRTLAGHPHAAAVQRILSAAMEAADPVSAVTRSLSLKDGRLAAGEWELGLEDVRRVRLVGLGKAAAAMAQGAVQVLGDRVCDGYLISKHTPGIGHGLPESIVVVQGDHPVPGPGSLEAAQGLEAFLADSAEADLVLCLISGGGSALAALPVDGVSLEDMQALTRLLLSSGASINEINALRKHLDRIKGGGLARMAQPASLLTLILSDVIGSPLDVIASGPTVPDSSTYADAVAVLEKYGMLEEVPQSITRILQEGTADGLPETVKTGDVCMQRGLQIVVSSNQAAAEAAVIRARQEGFITLLLTTFLQGEAAQAGVFLAGLLQEVGRSGQPVPRPACLIAGGETTVTLGNDGSAAEPGLGGRNTELALGAVDPLSGLENVLLVTLATDGEDGTGEAAGAVVDGDTLEAAGRLGLNPADYLHRHDSFHFFHALDDLLRPGPTGTNVNDLVFLFAF
jgi:glycerate 2-kinase